MIGASLRGLLGEARDVLLPRGCAGCDEPDRVLCPDCRALFSERGVFALPGCESGIGRSCAVYRGRARRAILAWKDHGDEECDAPFAELLADLAVRCGAVDRDRQIALVPAPSSAASMRSRGRWHMRNLVDRTARVLRDQGFDAVALPVLRASGVRSKSVQAGGAAQRAARIGGNIVVDDPRLCRGGTVVPIDDIVTTGATMRQCVAALDAAGARVLTALSLARVP